MNLRIGEMKNRVLAPTRDQAQDARRLVEACMRHDLPDAIEASLVGVLPAGVKPSDMRLAVRHIQLRVRLKSRDRHALSIAWAQAITAPIAAALAKNHALSAYEGENIAWFDSPVSLYARYIKCTLNGQIATQWWWPSLLQPDFPGRAALPSMVDILCHQAQAQPESFARWFVDLWDETPRLRAALSDRDCARIWATYLAAGGVYAAGPHAPNPRGTPSADIVQQIALRTALMCAPHRRLTDAQTTNGAHTLLARLLVRLAAPSAAEPLVCAAAAEVLDHALSATAFESPSPESPDADRNAQSTQAGDKTGQTLAQRAQDAANPIIQRVQTAGLAMLINPLLTSALLDDLAPITFRRRLETVVVAALRRITPPREGALRSRLMREMPMLTAWFAGPDDPDAWLDPDDDLAAIDWLDAFEATLPEFRCFDRRLDPLCPHYRLGCLLTRPGRIAADGPYTDLYLPMHSVDIEIRKRGWDIDPGFIPRLGLVLRFHYEDQEPDHALP